MKILIADDSPVSRMMLTGIVKEWGYEVISAEDGAEAWDILQQPDAPQLLLLDWEMPKMSGTEVCERILEEFTHDPPYVILLTSRTESEDIVEGLSKGANDYISKPFDTSELQVRLQVGKRVLVMQESLNLMVKELEDLASHDALTGTLNRRAIMEALPVEIKRAQRHNKVLCVGMCDIDHFKNINDTYGHLVGDEVLKEVTKRMQSATRSYDLIGRFGGEEFLVITSTDEENLSLVYERICNIISEKPINIEGGASIDVTISCGVTKYDVESQQDASQFISVADSALYEAKATGRNRVVFK